MPSVILSFITSFFSKTTNPLAMVSGLTKHGKVFVFAVLFGVVSYQNFWNGPEFLFGLDTVPNKTEQNNDLSAKIADLRNRNDQYQASIEQSNRVIGEWKTKTDALEQEHKKLQQKIESVRQQYSREVQRILQDNVPQTCEEAFDYLKKGAKDLQW